LSEPTDRSSKRERSSRIWELLNQGGLPWKISMKIGMDCRVTDAYRPTEVIVAILVRRDLEYELNNSLKMGFSPVLNLDLPYLSR
jgi:hypothetical protein